MMFGFGSVSTRNFLFSNSGYGLLEPLSFYESLTMKDLKELCRAANLSPTGLKALLVQRLCNEPASSAYAYERRHPNHVTKKALGEMCRSRSIKKSGSRYELVLRLVQHDTNAVNKVTKAASLLSSNNNSNNNTKRGSYNDDNDDDGGGGGGNKKKKPKPTRSQVVSNKIQRKIASGCTNKKYNSHWGAKTHSEDVYELLDTILDQEISNRNNLINRKPKVALEIAKGAFTSLSSNFDGIISPGYDMSSHVPNAISTLGDVVMRVIPELSVDEVTDLNKWVEELQTNLDPYGLADGSDPSIEDILLMCSKTEEEDDDDTEPNVATISLHKKTMVATAIDPSSFSTIENQAPSNTV